MRYTTVAAVILIGLILSSCQTEQKVDGMDYESVRERHVILEENICVNPQSASEIPTGMIVGQEIGTIEKMLIMPCADT